MREPDDKWSRTARLHPPRPGAPPGGADAGTNVTWVIQRGARCHSARATAMGETPHHAAASSCSYHAIVARRPSRSGVGVMSKRSSNADESMIWGSRYW